MQVYAGQRDLSKQCSNLLKTLDVAFSQKSNWPLITNLTWRKDHPLLKPILDAIEEGILSA